MAKYIAHAYQRRPFLFAHAHKFWKQSASDGCVFAKRGGTEEYSAAVSRDKASSSSHGSEPARGRSAALARGSAGAHADPRIVHPARERGSVEREFPEVREDICLLRMQRESINHLSLQRAADD